MKIQLQKVFGAIGIISASLVALADSETVNGVTWMYTADADGIATITNQTGAAGVVNVPTTLGGKLVKKIGEGLFLGNTAITRVLMPSITDVGKNAFSRCDNLTGVSMPIVEAVGYNAFFSSTNFTGDLYLPLLKRINQFGFQKTGITSATLPNLEELNYRGFQGCSSLTNISMPKVAKIDGDAFHDCLNLTGDLYLPEVETVGDAVFRRTKITSVYMPLATSIGTNGFYDCRQLTNVVARKVRIVRKFGFQDCWNLKSLSYMPNLTRIEEKGFQRCKELTSIKLPLCMTTLETIAFDGCTKLSEIAIHADSNLDEARLKSGNSANITRHGGTEVVNGVSWTYDDFADGTALIVSQSGATGAVTIPATLGGKQVTRIGKAVFSGNTAITSVQMSGIVEIGENAFRQCSNLVEVTMPNVEFIGENAFYQCTKLAGDFILPNLLYVDKFGLQQTGITSIKMANTEYIGFRGFQGCSSLTNVEMTALRMTGKDAFYECTKLAGVLDLPNLLDVNDSVFSKTKVSSINLPIAVRIGNHAFLDTTLTRAEFPCVKWVGSNSFKNAPLTHVDLPQVTDVGENAFYNGQSMVSLSMPRLKRIKRWGLQTCSKNLTEIGYMPRLKSVEMRAFKDNDRLTQIKLPYNTQVMTLEPFMTCSVLKTILIHAGSQLNEANLKSQNSAAVTRYGGYEDVNGVRWMYDDLADGTLVLVGASGATGDLEIPSRLNGKRVTQIETGAFEDYVGINAIKLPRGINVVGEEAFLNCDGLMTIRVPDVRSDLFASLRQEYGDDRVETYASGGTVIILR